LCCRTAPGCGFAPPSRQHRYAACSACYADDPGPVRRSGLVGHQRAC
jgi:hypothetical protein